MSKVASLTEERYKRYVANYDLSLDESYISESELNYKKRIAKEMTKGYLKLLSKTK